MRQCQGRIDRMQLGMRNGGGLCVRKLQSLHASDYADSDQYHDPPVCTGVCDSIISSGRTETVMIDLLPRHPR
jgi:hypothetical protein